MWKWIERGAYIATILGHANPPAGDYSPPTRGAWWAGRLGYFAEAIERT